VHGLALERFSERYRNPGTEEGCLGRNSSAISRVDSDMAFLARVVARVQSIAQGSVCLTVAGALVAGILLGAARVTVAYAGDVHVGEAMVAADALISGAAMETACADSWTRGRTAYRGDAPLAPVDHAVEGDESSARSVLRAWPTVVHGHATTSRGYEATAPPV
jgi:roadblock/LC7 domain-containing protein